MTPDLHLVPTGPHVEAGDPRAEPGPAEPDAAVAPTVPRPRDALDVEPVGDGTTPRARECLPCYVGRLLGQHGCDGTLRWAMRWRDACAPRAHKLDRRLGDHGGFCDCEVLFNVFPGHDPGGGCDGRKKGGAMSPCRPPGLTGW